MTEPKPVKSETKSNVKIVHLTVGRVLSSGQRKQLRYESLDARAILDVEWVTLALHTEAPQYQHERQIPWVFRPLFLRNLYGWCYAYMLSKKFDLVMLRHMTFDPFALLSVFVPNRISVHHSKEVYELRLIKGVLGRLASLLERIAGAIALYNAKAVVSVTREIAKYEAARCIKSKKNGVYPNGISLDCVSLAEDNREGKELNIVFMCGVFSSWHGLDLLVEAVDKMQSNDSDEQLKIHLIGGLSGEQSVALTKTKIRKNVFVNHGTLDRESYLPILDRCNLGLTSFGLDRKGLAEAATLKVRELLGMGIPVYSGHIDTALSDEFPFYMVSKFPNIAQIRRFCLETREIPRKTVREQARRHISKSHQMKQLLTWMDREGLLSLSEKEIK